VLALGIFLCHWSLLAHLLWNRKSQDSQIPSAPTSVHGVHQLLRDEKNISKKSGISRTMPQDGAISRNSLRHLRGFLDSKLETRNWKLARMCVALVKPATPATLLMRKILTCNKIRNKGATDPQHFAFAPIPRPGTLNL
jgi:hypothetical protein